MKTKCHIMQHKVDLTFFFSHNTCNYQFKTSQRHLIIIGCKCIHTHACMYACKRKHARTLANKQNFDVHMMHIP